MASPRRQKEALRAAIFAYFGGAHYITEAVEKAQSLTSTGSGKDATELRHAMLEADYQRFKESGHVLEGFIDSLNEEDLYPFGSEWPGEAIAMLAEKTVPPKLSIDESEHDLKFRFKKGFKDLLSDLASGIESTAKKSSSLDHWMVLLLNSAFQAGAVAAARNAENPKVYYDALPELEEVTEPWSRYPQLADMLDRQLRRETRRKTGLVTDYDF